MSQLRYILPRSESETIDEAANDDANIQYIDELFSRRPCPGVIDRQVTVRRLCRLSTDTGSQWRTGSPTQWRIGEVDTSVSNRACGGTARQLATSFQNPTENVVYSTEI